MQFEDILCCYYIALNKLILSGVLLTCSILASRLRDSFPNGSVNGSMELFELYQVMT